MLYINVNLVIVSVSQWLMRYQTDIKCKLMPMGTAAKTICPSPLVGVCVLGGGDITLCNQVHVDIHNSRPAFIVMIFFIVAPALAWAT